MGTEGAGYMARIATEADLPAIADFFERHDYGPKDLDWVRWKFLDNPDGPAFMFVGESSDATIVGFRADMPRRFTSEKMGAFIPRQAADVFVSPEHRGKRVLTKIEELVQAGRDYMDMGFPNKTYMVRGGITEKDTLLPLREWWYPLNIGGLIAGKPYGFLAPLANALSRLYAKLWLRGRLADIEIRPIERFERDYALDPDFIQGVRSKAYLNWRFIDNPMRRYLACQFVEGEQEIGYCVYAKAKNGLEIFDLMIDRRHRSCLKLLVDHCRAQGSTHMVFRCAGFKFGGFGFVPRRASNYFTYEPPRDGSLRIEGPWKITLADSDY